ncbi:MAG: hypothetical protein KAH95_16485 [Spirochaetales bacterium]|nr:hypothetical protein [Spirochaetales bacterium]
MHTLNIRGIGDSLYSRIKLESKNKGLSINKFLVAAISGLFSEKDVLEYHDMDDLFGTWTREEYDEVDNVVAESRVIDDELWN